MTVAMAVPAPQSAVALEGSRLMTQLVSGCLPHTYCVDTSSPPHVHASVCTG